MLLGSSIEDARGSAFMRGDIPCLENNGEFIIQIIIDMPLYRPGYVKDSTGL